MKRYSRDGKSPLLAALWAAALISVIGMFVFLPENSWDLRVSSEALAYLRAGLDPYSASITHQQAEAALGNRVFLYWYPPVSILFLKALNFLPALVRAVSFWIIYAAGFFAQLWAGSQFLRPAERRVLRWIFPLTLFFPAFVPSDAIVSGNIAIPMYGALMAAGAHGWKSGRWSWFYAVVLVASLLKPPMLIWLAMPILVGSAQYARAVTMSAIGVGAFGIQKFLWPERFALFMQSVRYALPQETNYSLVATFDSVLDALGHRSTVALGVFYLLISCAIFGTMLYFARECRRGSVESQDLAAVAVIAITLLAPRLKEYDTLPITLPMAAIVLRGIKSLVPRVIFIAGLGTVAVSLIAGQLTAVDTISIATLFLIGTSLLAIESRETRLAQECEVEFEVEKAVL